MMGQRGQRWNTMRRYRERLKRRGLCPRCAGARRKFICCAKCRRYARKRKKGLTSSQRSGYNQGFDGNHLLRP